MRPIYSGREMKKTLYDMLQVQQNATCQEIKEAYAKQMAHYQSEATASSTVDHSKFIKDAYDILSNPVKRKQYDESIAVRAAPQVIFVEETRGLDLKVVGLIGVFVLGGGWYYLDHSREQERLKIERAAQIIQEQQALEKARLEQQALMEQRRLDITEKSVDHQQTLAERRAREQENRYFDQLHRQEEEAERRKKAEDEQRRSREQREAELRERRDRAQAQAELMRQKAWADRAERERR